MKNQWSRNGEGYSDKTAGTAIQNIVREERKKRMAKKKKCRRKILFKRKLLKCGK